MRTQQGGFSLLQIIVAIAVGVGISAGLLQTYAGIQRQGDFDIVMGEARRVALIADNLQNRVVASSINGDEVYEYTYVGATSTWREVEELATESGVDIPTETAYGTPYEYRADGFPAQIRFVVPAADADSVTPTGDLDVENLPGGGIRVSFQRVRQPELRRSTRLRTNKSYLYLEELR